MTSTFFAFHAIAGEHEFAYTYPSNVLKKSQREIEVWSTYRVGRDNFYRSLEHRAEFEAGLTNHLQTAFYVNFSSSVEGYNIDSATMGLRKSHFTGISSEWKFQMSDPVANSIGSALYGELSLSPDEVELEAKLILDKRFGKFYAGLNLVNEAEFENEIEGKKVESELEDVAEVDFGLNYHIRENCSLGFETRNRNIFAEGEWESSALYLGPSVSYRAENWWMAFSLMPQVSNLHKEDAFSGPLELHDNEKLNARLLFSFAL